MEQPVSQTKVLRSGPVHYLVTEIDSARPVLLMLSGWPVSCFSLVSLMRELSSEFCCYSLDLPGFGRSVTDADRRHTFDFYRGCIREFHRTVLGNQTISIFGHSLGGVHALYYAAAFPKKIKNLFLYGTPSNGISHFQKTIEEHNNVLVPMFAAIQKHPESLPILDIPIFKQALAKWALHAIYMKRYDKFNQLDHDYMDHLINETSNFCVKAPFDIALELSRSDFTAQARTILISTLVIAGRQDTAVFPETSRTLAQEILPLGTYVELADADHESPITEAPVVAAEILHFIRRQQALTFMIPTLVKKLKKLTWKHI